MHDDDDDDEPSTDSPTPRLTGLAAARAGWFGLQGDSRERWPDRVTAALSRTEGRRLQRLARRWGVSYATAVRRAMALADGVSDAELRWLYLRSRHTDDEL